MIIKGCDIHQWFTAGVCWGSPRTARLPIDQFSWNSLTPGGGVCPDIFWTCGGVRILSDSEPETAFGPWIWSHFFRIISSTKLNWSCNLPIKRLSSVSVSRMKSHQQFRPSKIWGDIIPLYQIKTLIFVLKPSNTNYIKRKTISSFTTLEYGSSSNTLINLPNKIDPESSVCINEKLWF